MSIPFNGISCMLLVAQDYTSVIKGKTCIKLARSTTKNTKKIQQLFDHCVLKSRKLAQHTKKVDCPFVLLVRKVLSFPLFKIEKNNKKRRTEASK